MTRIDLLTKRNRLRDDVDGINMALANCKPRSKQHYELADLLVEKKAQYCFISELMKKWEVN